MSEDNNMFGNNGQQSEPGQQPASFQQPQVNLNKGIDQQPQTNLNEEVSQQPQANLNEGASQQPQAGLQNYQQPQGYGGQQPGYNQPQGYNQHYGDQNQQTPLSGHAEPVYHNQYTANYEEQGQGFGIASLICGILSIVTCCCSCPCAPLAIVSIVLGILQISKGAGSGRGMAIAGIICSAVGLILMVISLVFTIVMNGSSFAEDYYENYYDIIQELENMDTYRTY